MLAFILSLVAWLPCVNANAMTNVIFREDGKMATVIMMGIAGDPDATALYNALKIPPEDFNGKWSKKLTALNAKGEHALDVDCVFSKMIPGNGTCTVIFHASEDLVTVSKSEGRARMWMNGGAAAKFSEAFAVRDDSTIVFRSANGRLNFSVARDRDAITDFVVDWR